MKQHATGTITSLNAHANGTHTSVEVAHGERAKKKGKSQGLMSADYDDRPTSRLHIPNARAAGLGIGQKVRVAVSPASAADPDDTPILAKAKAK